MGSDPHDPVTIPRHLAEALQNTMDKAPELAERWATMDAEFREFAIEEWARMAALLAGALATSEPAGKGEGDLPPIDWPHHMRWYAAKLRQIAIGMYIQAGLTPEQIRDARTFVPAEDFYAEFPEMRPDASPPAAPGGCARCGRIDCAEFGGCGRQG